MNLRTTESRTFRCEQLTNQNRGRSRLDLERRKGVACTRAPNAPQERRGRTAAQERGEVAIQERKGQRPIAALPWRPSHGFKEWLRSLCGGQRSKTRVRDRHRASISTSGQGSNGESGRKRPGSIFRGAALLPQRGVPRCSDASKGSSSPSPRFARVQRAAGESN